MSIPFYVSPEQVISDKANFARDRVARGREVVALQYADGILLVSENSSRLLRKISEIYDRIAFAGVGKGNEFDALRQAGVRHADVKGYQYSREDVDGRSLANVYGQILGQIFTHELKPYEVEILVVEVGFDPSDDELYHVRYDGIVSDEEHWVVAGGSAEEISERVKEAWQEAMPLAAALKAAVSALSGPDRTIEAGRLEVAVLERAAGRRAFRRVEGEELEQLLA